MKRGKKKKYYTQTINFGKEGDRSRGIVEAVEQRNGAYTLSKFVRDATIAYADTTLPKLVKAKVLFNEIAYLREQIGLLSVQVQYKEELLNGLGYDEEQIRGAI